MCLHSQMWKSFKRVLSLHSHDMEMKKLGIRSVQCSQRIIKFSGLETESDWKLPSHLIASRSCTRSHALTHTLSHTHTRTLTRTHSHLQRNDHFVLVSLLFETNQVSAFRFFWMEQLETLLVEMKLASRLECSNIFIAADFKNCATQEFWIEPRGI